MALKPVISGFDPADLYNDTALIAKSLGQEATPEAMEALSPWRYKAPLAPNMAAAKEGMPVDIKALVDFCLSHAKASYDGLLVEGVGGIMVPLTDTHTVLDWMQALGWPVLLVAGSYLGTISHTLSAAELLKARGITLKGIIISESEDASVSLQDTVSTLEKFCRRTIPVLAMERLSSSDELWKNAPPLDGLCHL